MKIHTILIMVILTLLSCQTSNKSESNTEVTYLNNNFSTLQNEDRFREAIRNNDLVTVKQILDSKSIDLNPPHVDNLINKPLAYAVQFGTLESVKLILEYDEVDIDGQVSYGDTSLLKALENGNIEMAKILIETGADLNIPNSFGYSPFTGLCMTGYTELVELALNKGARINEAYMVTNNSDFGSYNLSALQQAVKKKHYVIVSILLENGGDPNFKTDNLSALDIAYEMNDKKMISLLEKYKDITELNQTSVVNLKLNNNSPISEDYQVNADIVRLRHLKYYGELLDEYFRKTGKYPFQTENPIPVYVNIANDKQEEYTKQLLPFEHTLKTHKEFINELENVLNRDIEEYFDPQYAPDNKPNFYIYVVSGKSMYFAVHVANKYPFSKKIADGYYKIELSNMLIPYEGFYTINYLKNNKSFKFESEKTIDKVDYFLDRENKYKFFTN